MCCWCDSIAVVPIVKVPEDAIPRAGCQHSHILNGTPVIDQAVPQSEEERFVLDDGAAGTQRVLVPIIPIERSSAPASRFRVDRFVVRQPRH